jgi:hypothetical protein
VRRVLFSLPLAAMFAVLTVLSLPSVPGDVAQWSKVLHWVDGPVWRYGLPIIGWIGIISVIAWLIRGRGSRVADSAKVLARRVLVELATIDSTVAAALSEGHWWNVRVTGLPGDKWDAAADTLSPEVHDVVYPVYVEADQLNKVANDYFSRGWRRELKDTERTRLESFRISLSQATEILRRYVR